MMRVYVEGIGMIGPGLGSWSTGCAVLCGAEPYVAAPAVIGTSELLPPAERRRATKTVQLVLAVGSEALAHAGRDPAATATVFTSSASDGETVHQICETLATPERDMSPTRFHNSVHNAAAGYWSIATGSREPSTSLCAHDASFAAGLLDAAAKATVDECAVALIAYDVPYPEPLHAKRPIDGLFATALVLTHSATPRSMFRLDIDVSREQKATIMVDAALEVLRVGVPAARSLPVLALFARKAPGRTVLDYIAGNRVSVEVAPCS